MDTSALKKFAQSARRDLVVQVSTRLDVVQAPNSDERRDYPAAVTALEAAIKKADREQVIEKAAYTWFNRFCALTFMDRNNYNAVHIVTPGEDGIRPAILSEALGGHVDATVPDKDRARIRALLDRTAPSREPELEAYKILLASACQQWHKRMPFMFGRIEDWTELLMPGDLLAETSVLNEMRAVMSEEACQDVEIIGWLYQFYISEKKDEVFAALKKNVKITAANIPAATQLFTPHWIVRYLVENSLGRLWLLNKPSSNLAAQMEYYIAPEEPETDFLRVSKPEEIKICDPAVGSGHMLTYAFDLLYAIYEEEGYSPDDIPALILTHNLTGIEIDDRAGALAAFALTMKAASKLGRRKFLQLKTQPNICVLQNVSFTESEMQDVAAVVGKDLFSDSLKDTLTQFEQAKNFGSLITPKLRNPSKALRIIEAEEFSDTFQIKDVKGRIAQVLRMGEALSPKYHVVVANPPYLGRSGMNPQLSGFAKQYYPDSKSDLFAIFMERGQELAQSTAYIAMINMQSWMFLSSYEKMRGNILSRTAILSMAHLGERAFDSIGGAVVSTTAFVLLNSANANLRGLYLRLVSGTSEREKYTAMREAITGASIRNSYLASANDFTKIPGNPIAYWVSEKTRTIFQNEDSISERVTSKQGLGTGEDAKFFRYHWEVSNERSSFGSNSAKDVWKDPTKRWVPLNKGGSTRKWYGNQEFLISFNQSDRDLLKTLGNHLPSENLYFKPTVSWSDITSATNSFRIYPAGFIFSNTGHSAFPTSEEDAHVLLSYCNNRFVDRMTKILNPTIHFHVGYFNLLPDPSRIFGKAREVIPAVRKLVKFAKSDWDAYETSWDFTTLPLLSPDYRGETLADSYTTLRAHWQSMTDEMQRLEEENNRIFIDAYGLQDELTPEVPLNEITLTCNPAYRYGVKASEDDRETRLRADTMAEYLAYAVGCMFGRYSLDAPGLILANQGERLEDYLARIPEPRFMPDEDNVIPVLDENWFPDDITERFRLFLRVTFGEAHFRENLKFIEDSLGKDIRKYFTKDFYKAHWARYKKRPIYWMISSPNGTFNALIYMHRYRGDTISVLLNDYLREFITKLEGERTRLEKLSDDSGASKGERNRALKGIDKVKRQITELKEWEREVIFPLAQQKIEIDLDDGVKANYPKLGAALKSIPGLS